MQFFNAAWFEGDDEDCKRILAKYEDYIITIKDHLPSELARFIDFVNLHDGLFKSIRVDRQSSQLEMQLVVGDLQVGYSGLKVRYHLLGVDDELLAALETIDKIKNTEVLYDEVLLLDEFVYAHNWLLYPEQELSIRFDQFAFEAVDVEGRDSARATPFLVIE